MPQVIASELTVCILWWPFT